MKKGRPVDMIASECCAANAPPNQHHDSMFGSNPNHKHVKSWARVHLHSLRVDISREAVEIAVEG